MWVFSIFRYAAGMLYISSFLGAGMWRGQKPKEGPGVGIPPGQNAVLFPLFPPSYGPSSSPNPENYRLRRGDISGRCGPVRGRGVGTGAHSGS